MAQEKILKIIGAHDENIAKISENFVSINVYGVLRIFASDNPIYKLGVKPKRITATEDFSNLGEMTGEAA